MYSTANVFHIREMREGFARCEITIRAILVLVIPLLAGPRGRANRMSHDYDKGWRVDFKHSTHNLCEGGVAVRLLQG